MEDAQTLVLSAQYSPLARVSWQRALTWALTGRVEILEEYEDRVVRSPSQVFAVPSVVRFLKKVVGYFRRGVKFNRKNVWLRDKSTCQYCGHKVSLTDFTFDHVLPRRMGGKTSWENIVVACYDCNQKKQDRTPQQAKMRLLHEPVQPKNLPGGDVSLLVGSSIPDSWKDYLGSLSYWQSTLASE
jgi:5-methylcytosine-specific restriction endonuclease McrA